MSAELNVGVLGAGWFGREAHLANLIRLDGVNVIAASSRSQSSLDKAKALVGEHLQTFTDWQKVIEIDSIDAVVIALTNDQHHFTSPRANGYDGCFVHCPCLFGQTYGRNGGLEGPS